jgi:hypothetical protein
MDINDYKQLATDWDKCHLPPLHRRIQRHNFQILQTKISYERSSKFSSLNG